MGWRRGKRGVREGEEATEEVVRVRVAEAKELVPPTPCRQQQGGRPASCVWPSATTKSKNLIAHLPQADMYKL